MVGSPVGGGDPSGGQAGWSVLVVRSEGGAVQSDDAVRPAPVRVVRGRAPTIEADRSATGRLLERAAEGEPGVRVWTPHRQVAFGRRDATLGGYDRAREAAAERGFEPVERRVGGRAVVYDGETTLSFAHAVPVDGDRREIETRYEATIDAVATALDSLALEPPAEPGEPADAFCPGSHSVRIAGGGKLVGIAQRVRRRAALVAGVCVVANPTELADAYAAVYDALDVPFDPGSVGSVAAAGGPADPAVVARTLEDVLVGDRPRTVASVEPSH